MSKRRGLLLFIVVFTIIVIPMTIYLALTGQFINKQAANATTVALFLPTFPELYSHTEDFTVTLGIQSPDTHFSSAVIVLEYNQADVQLTTITTDPNFDYLGDNPANSVVKRFSIISKNPQQHTVGEPLTPAELTFHVKTKNKRSLIRLSSTGITAIGMNPTTNQDVSLTTQIAGEVGFHVPGPLCRIDMCTAANTIEIDTIVTADRRYAVYLTWDNPGTTDDLFFKIYRNSGSPVPEGHPNQYFVSLTQVYKDPTTNIMTTGYYDTNSGAGFAPDQELFYDIDTYKLCPQQ